MKKKMKDKNKKNKNKKEEKEEMISYLPPIEWVTQMIGLCPTPASCSFLSISPLRCARECLRR